MFARIRQVIDLEALARHRGSVFGAINHPSSSGASSSTPSSDNADSTRDNADSTSDNADSTSVDSTSVNDIVDAPYRQPTCEQMENALALEWAALDPNRPVWLEDESRAIGAVRVPDAVFAQVHFWGGGRKSRKNNTLTVPVPQFIQSSCDYKIQVEYKH